MTYDVEAIYEQGVFRPIEPLVIPDGTRVQLQVDDSTGIVPDAIATEAIRKQQKALAELRARMDSLPSNVPQDGLGGADHDLILYGRQQ